MGLDLVELVMSVEETFGISIPDDDAVGIGTVGQLHDYVVAKRFANLPETCLSSRAFYILRRAINGATGVDRRDLRPSTAVENLLPRESRRYLWNQVSSRADLRLPDLEPGRALWLIIAAIAGAGFAGTLSVVVPHTSAVAAGLCGVVSALIVVVALLLITQSRHTAFPAGITTLRELTARVLTLNYGELAKREGTWSQAEVWATVQALVVEQLGVKLEHVTRDAHFVYDLGAD
ncbi:phosphopantetheine-binding protein [Planctomycetota bacterium]